MSRLRSYARIAERSEKVKAEAEDFAAVYAEVDARSEGRCEVTTDTQRCARRATQHHHLFKPRRSHHTAEQIVHVCPACHDRCEWPYKRGRLCYLGTRVVGAVRVFTFAIRFASDKFAARAGA